MPRAIWNGVVIAESDHTEIVEGNHYFPIDTVNEGYLKESGTQTHCPWKGMASYYSIEVNGESNKDAAWCYPTPKSEAINIKNHVAFWRGVQIER